MASEIEDPSWLPAALVDLDRMRADALAQVDDADEPAPNNREARECIRLSAELRGLLGAAAKRAPTLDRGKDPEWERMTPAEKLEQLDAVRADVLAEAAREAAAGRH